MSSNTAASNSSDESFMDHSEAMEVLVTLSEAELSAVEGWRKANNIPHLPQAVRSLIRVGLLSQISESYDVVNALRDSVD